METKNLTLETFFGYQKFIDKDGNEYGMERLKGKVVGIYFSAHWCPPCRMFTPELARVYQEIVKQDPNFEIVFYSLDNDKKSMMEYMKQMPWLAIPWESRDLGKGHKSLPDRFGVQGIPALMVVDKTGNIISHSGRKDVMELGAKVGQLWLPGIKSTLASTG